MLLYHPIPVPTLVEAWILDRLGVEPTGDRDRPSLRFFRNYALASMTAEAMQAAWDRRRPIAGPETEFRQGAVLAFDRATLSSATPLVSVREARDDLREDETELRARADLVRFRARVRTIHLDDADVDLWLAAYAGGHPDDDGTGRWTEAARAALADLYRDPRRIPADPVGPPRR